MKALADFLLLLIQQFLRHFFPGKTQIALGRESCASRRQARRQNAAAIAILILAARNDSMG